MVSFLKDEPLWLWIVSGTQPSQSNPRCAVGQTVFHIVWRVGSVIVLWIHGAVSLAHVGGGTRRICLYRRLGYQGAGTGRGDAPKVNASLKKRGRMKKGEVSLRSPSTRRSVRLCSG